METEVIPKKTKRTRRYLTANYKLEILKEIDACTDESQVGSLLRRERLLSAQVANWRKQQQEAESDVFTEKKRGPKVEDSAVIRDELQQLRKENQKLRERLLKAETIISVQKKVSILLEFPPFQDLENNS